MTRDLRAEMEAAAGDMDLVLELAELMDRERLKRIVERGMLELGLVPQSLLTIRRGYGAD